MSCKARRIRRCSGFTTGLRTLLAHNPWIANLSGLHLPGIAILLVVYGYITLDPRRREVTLPWWRRGGPMCFSRCLCLMSDDACASHLLGLKYHTHTHTHTTRLTLGTHMEPRAAAYCRRTGTTNSKNTPLKTGASCRPSRGKYRRARQQQVSDQNAAKSRSSLRRPARSTHAWRKSNCCTSTIPIIRLVQV